MDFKKLIIDTLSINSKFKNRLGKQGRMLDLVEEVGELANAMLMVDGNKTSGDPAKQRTKEDISDAIADILYDLIILSDHYDVDLDVEYTEMLTRMKQRFENSDLIGK